ncbi:hypothetical protein CspeluHIS016_0501530 [Cutaneotrichosporon spelunceum]|uniref:MFS general substrate transporter n=1 Tax=Cutaneotrichosporon spelunceum TaxID=1672016 RepID=A0AAD3TWF6_9TREE|nr:hypothetical protein CspeluHIS016_0501530 [Cutaneotrichosporon spelunceum]
MTCMEIEKGDASHAENASGSGTGTGSEAPAYTADEEKRVRRRTDFVLLPMFCAIFALGFLDKTALTYASVMGIRSAAKLTIAQYAWLGSIYYFGYLAGCYPMSVGHQRLPASKFTAATIILWGATTLLTAALLGFLESTIAPATIMFTAEWYRKEEQSTRVGIWGSFSTWGGILGAGVAYGLSSREVEAKWGKSGTVMAIPSWKGLFLFLGGLTVLIGLIFLIVVPDTIDGAFFLSSRDKEVAKLRTLENKQNISEKHWKWYQVREALLDPAVWLLCALTVLSYIPNGGITNFYAIIVMGMGFNVQEALLLSMANAWLSIGVIVTMWAADRIKCRSLAGIPLTIVSIVGGVMVWVLPRSQKIARLAGFYLSLAFAIPTFVAMTLLASNIAGRTKKTFVTGLVLVFNCTGNLIGPQAFRDKDAPVYAPALLTFVVCNAINLCILVAFFLYYRSENARRDRLYGKPLPDEDQFVDLTDRENKSFRYML